MNHYKILVFLHGSLMGTYPIQRNPQDKIITLSALGEGCIIDKKCDDGLINTYLEGDSIFNNDDNDNNLTSKGEDIQRSCGFVFKNHRNESVINNVYLSTRGVVPGAARILVLIKLSHSYVKLKDIIPTTDWDLKTLFHYCSHQFIGERTFILRTCRVWPSYSSLENFERLSRVVSDNTYEGDTDQISDLEEYIKLRVNPPIIKNYTNDLSPSSKQSRNETSVPDKSFEKLQRGFLSPKKVSKPKKTITNNSTEKLSKPSQPQKTKKTTKTLKGVLSSKKGIFEGGGNLGSIIKKTKRNRVKLIR